jgi:anti-anti-sigma factor
MTEMNISQIEGITVVKLAGELTHVGTPAVERGFVLTIGALERAVVDFSGVTMITTPGITLLIAADRTLRRKGGMLVVTGLHGSIEEVLLDRCRLDVVLHIEPDIAAGVKKALGKSQ